MFILHSSNKTENLLEHLQAVLAASPLHSPFDKEVFLIQSQGMERWLSQQLALRFKVWGNFEFLFPGRFFSEIAASLGEVAVSGAFDRDVMLWRLEAQLRQTDDAALKVLAQYISGENSGLKRFQLARQLAQVFDQYQIMRPDMLSLWLQGEEIYQAPVEKWQQILWQRIIKASEEPHRAALWLQLIEKMDAAESGAYTQQLPERISIFGINSMPPLFLAFLQAMARHCDVHFYLLNPVQVYWGDVPRKKLQAKLQAFDGHPLLVTLGQQGREFQQLLLDQAQFELELDSFEAAAAQNNVQQLQNDILNNLTPQTALTPDNSISIHACHSRLREVQVVRQQVLAALERDDALELRDIVVMAPDIQQYAPFIAAEFSDFQHSVADRSLRLSNALLDMFINFLQLSQSRFGWQSVMQILEHPCVYRQFNLHDDDIGLIRFWVDDLNVRWGRDAEHKQQLGLPAVEGNTWQAALDRLFMGYACAGDEMFIDGILPYPNIEGLSAKALGGLHDYLMLACRAADECARPRSLTEWSALLVRYAESLLGFDDSLARRQLHELLLSLDERFARVNPYDVELAVVIHWMQDTLEENKSSTGFLRGQLTFCAMLPMRSIPFKMIVLMGLNEGEFPRMDRAPTFDLLSRHYRPGDRSRRADDRYQFLEILLSARQQLVLTYLGQSLKDNADIPPSVVVSELLDVLQHYQLNDCVTRHPLHAFSERYFDQSNAQLFSYQQQDCEIAKQRQQPHAVVENWWQGQTAAEQGQVIGLPDLFNFYRHPQRYFLQQQLNIRLTGLQAEADERETFALDGLENYQVQQDWLQAELQGAEFDLPALQAKGNWPQAAAGEILFEQMQHQVSAFAEVIRGKQIGLPLDALSVDIQCGRYRLVGTLANRFENGVLLYRLSALKGKDFFIAWLHHLVINQLEAQDSWLLAADDELHFAASLADSKQLNIMLDTFMHGQQHPDAFLTEPAFWYLQDIDKGKLDTEQVLSKCRGNLLQFMEEGRAPECSRLFDTREAIDSLFDADFASRCEVFIPVWRAAHGR